MSTSEVIGVQISRFTAILSIYVKFRSRTGPYMERSDTGTLSSNFVSGIWHYE